MNTSITHIFTSLLPFLFAVIALVFLGYGTYLDSVRTVRTGMILLIINAIITTFTSAMGGASIRMVKLIPGVEKTIVSHHAWTGMAAFLVSVLIAFYALPVIRLKIYTRKKVHKVFILVMVFLLLVAGSGLIALKIR